MNGGLRLHAQTQPARRHASNPVPVRRLGTIALALLSGSPRGATLGSIWSFGFTYLEQRTSTTNVIVMHGTHGQRQLRPASGRQLGVIIMR